MVRASATTLAVAMGERDGVARAAVSVYQPVAPAEPVSACGGRSKRPSLSLARLFRGRQRPTESRSAEHALSPRGARLPAWWLRVGCGAVPWRFASRAFGRFVVASFVPCFSSVAGDIADSR